MLLLSKGLKKGRRDQNHSDHYDIYIYHLCAPRVISWCLADPATMATHLPLRAGHLNGYGRRSDKIAIALRSGNALVAHNEWSKWE